MYYYKIAALRLRSFFSFHSYAAFACEPGEADVTLETTDIIPPECERDVSGDTEHCRVPGGWFITTRDAGRRGLFVNDDYSLLRITGAENGHLFQEGEWLVRLALECWLARHGFVSIHAAAVEKGGQAYAFSGPSGIGKSTRAKAWEDTLDAELINGDRPLIDTRNFELYGVPWDGKEQSFRNVHYPLKAICEVRRSDLAFIRNMSYMQRRKLILRQGFMPMWDTETSVIQISNISRLARNVDMVRIFGGPTAEGVQAIYNDLQKRNYLKEGKDMKAKSGFVLRNVVDEFILMPTGDNIGQFNGTVLLNEVSAFVWEKLQNAMSREDLLNAVLDEFDVEKAAASADLDTLLKTLLEFGVIEND